jgi:hypothetical protein
VRSAPTRIVAALLALAALPAGAAGQGSDFDARLDPATRAAVQPTLVAAARDSLPVMALRSKVLEGIAKGVAPDRIGAVVTELASELRDARLALRRELPDRPIADGEVVAVALATRQGVAPEVVRALWASRPEAGSLEIPVTVLGELVRRGVPVADAAAVMAHVVRSAVPLQVAAQLPGKVDGALGAGVQPSAALGEALRALEIPAPPGRRPNE